MTTYQEEYERIIKIHEEYPMFVEWEHVRDDLLPLVAIATLVITLVFSVATAVMRNLFPGRDQRAIYRFAYQITNGLVNALLGVLGLYYFYFVHESDPTLESRVIGTREAFPICCIQFGYNLWAIPVGIAMVEESSAMLLHHIAVLFVTTMSATGTTGHKWYSPFMYGVIELSSVPLAVMNAFKDNPGCIKKYPITYQIFRYTFAFSFLYIRWYLFLPLMYDLLRTLGFSVITQNTLLAIVCSGTSWCAAFLLCLMQLYWGVLVVKGILNGILGLAKKLTARSKTE